MMAETIAGNDADGSESTTVYSSTRAIEDRTIDTSKPSSNVVTAAQFALSAAEEDVKTEEYVLICFPSSLLQLDSPFLPPEGPSPGLSLCYCPLNRAFDPISSWDAAKNKAVAPFNSTGELPCFCQSRIFLPPPILLFSRLLRGVFVVPDSSLALQISTFHIIHMLPFTSNLNKNI
jgi:hypothetical protein